MPKRAGPSRMLPSDPEYLLEYMENCSDSSDDEFDGYLYEDEHSANNDDSGEEDCDEPSSATNVCQGRQRSMF